MGERCKALAERAGLVGDSHPISLTRVPLAIPHPLPGEKSICATDSLSTSHQKIYCREGSLGIVIVEREPEARLNVGWRIGESKEDITLNHTAPSQQGGCSPPFSPDLSEHAQVFTAAVNLTVPGKLEGDNGNHINLEVDCGVSICRL